MKFTHFFKFYYLKKSNRLNRLFSLLKYLFSSSGLEKHKKQTILSKKINLFLHTNQKIFKGFTFLPLKR